MTGDVEATREALGEALSLLLWYLARGICLFSTMAWLSPRMALVTALVLPFLLLLPRAIGRLQQVRGGCGPAVTSVYLLPSPFYVPVVTSMCPPSLGLLSPQHVCCPLHVPAAPCTCPMSPPSTQHPLHVPTVPSTMPTMSLLTPPRVYHPLHMPSAPSLYPIPHLPALW